MHPIALPASGHKLGKLCALSGFLSPHAFDYFSPQDSLALSIHLCFSVPSALLMPVMLYTGLTHRRDVHLFLAGVFAMLWLGTFVTGIFFLPHTAPP